MGSTLTKPAKLKGVRVSALTDQQQVFVEEYLKDFNGTRAATAAGYKVPGGAAQRILKQNKIQRAINKALWNRMNRCRLDSDAVLKHLAAALFLDPLDVFHCNPDGTIDFKDLQDIPVEVRRCITKMDVNSVETDEAIKIRMKLEFMSKDAALVNAMKHLGLIAPDNKFNQQDGAGALVDMLQEVEEERKVIDGKVINKIAEDL